MSELPKPWSRNLSAPSVNMSAAWFGVVVVVPNFWPLGNLSSLMLLMFDLFAGILFLLITVRLEEVLEKQ